MDQLKSKSLPVIDVSVMSEKHCLTLSRSGLVAAQQAGQRGFDKDTDSVERKHVLLLFVLLYSVVYETTICNKIDLSELFLKKVNMIYNLNCLLCSKLIFGKTKPLVRVC